MWAPDYITSAELKTFTGNTVTTHDAAVATAVTAASRAVDDHCNRQFGQVASVEERVYTARWDYYRARWIVDVDDLQDVTGLDVQLPDGPVTLYTLEPANAVLKGKAWTRLVVSDEATIQPCGTPNEVTITALWGWSSVPVPVKQATLLQGSRLFSRRSSPYGIAGSPDQGSELRLLSRVDPDVGVSLRGYVRRRAVG